MTETERYQIQGELGQGAMAVVYKAYDTRMKRFLALKVLRQERCINEKFRRRFLREAHAAGKLSHENIVTIYDVGEIDNRPFIAMEMLPGKFLDEVIDGGTRFKWREVVDIGMQLAAALDQAHNNGVIHRDIKPANIAWIPEKGKVIITDFGIAHVAGLPETQITQMGEVFGTPKYMSPEQIVGETVDTRSDLFSLGVVLYQLVTGRRPFGGDTIASLTYQIAHQTPCPISDYVSDIPQSLIEIINKLLAKDTQKRYQSSRELMLELASLHHAPLAAGQKHQHRSLLIGALSLVIVAIIGVVIFILPRQSIGPPEIARPEADMIPPPQQAVKKSHLVLQDNILSHLQEFECARLNAVVGTGKSVIISGHLQEQDLMTLMEMMDIVPGISNVTYDIDALQWPYCEVSIILSPYRQKNLEDKLGLKLGGFSGTTQLMEGNKLVVELTSPNYESYMYVDYYRSDGKVIHLYPVGADNLTQSPPTTHFLVGQSGRQWRIQSPFGQNMLVVMASYNPLFNGERQKMESAQEYLAFLYQQIVVNKQELTAEFRLLTTEPNP